MLTDVIGAGKELVSDGQQVSTMRVMCLLTCLVACGAAIYGLVRGKDLSGLAMLCSALLTPAFAGKTIQSHFETRGDL